MKIWYYETSAVNLLQQDPHLGTLATRNYQLGKGRDWRLSPTTIWEILLTTDVHRREVLIDFCQHLFSGSLLPPPDELIVGFIQNGMPRVEPKRNLVSNAALAVAWSEIVNERDRTLRFDDKQLAEKRAILESVCQKHLSHC